MKKKIIRLFVSIVIATMIFVLGIVLSLLIKYSPTWVNLAANALFFIGLVYLLYDTKKGWVSVCDFTLYRKENELK